jgi:hypothetical protein
LDGKGQFTHLVQKQGPPVSLCHQTVLGLVGTGKRPFFMAEQNTLHEGFGQGGAVDHHKVFFSAGVSLQGDRRHRAVGGPWAVGVDGPGKKLFSGSGFSGDQHVDFTGGGLGQQVEAGAHIGAVADDPFPFDRRRGFTALFLFLILERAVDGREKLIYRRFFFQVVPGTVFQGEFGSLGRAVAGDDNHLGITGKGFQSGEEVEPVAVRHFYIQQDDFIGLSHGLL